MVMVMLKEKSPHRDFQWKDSLTKLRKNDEEKYCGVFTVSSSVRYPRLILTCCAVEPIKCWSVEDQRCVRIQALDLCKY